MRIVRLAFSLLIAMSAFGGQVMDEVWFPAGVIRWGHTQTTTDILAGIRDTMNYYATHTPLQLTEIPYINQGGMTPTELMGTLEIRYSEGVFNDGYGGQTKHYRNPNQGNKRIKLSFENVKTRERARSVLAHEMGHALGFTHEFQRWDRDENGVTLSFALGRDPYNGGRPDKKNVRVLTPYDFESKFATGYDGAQPPHNGPPAGTLLSRHDINAIYRVYGRPLGPMSAGLEYGEAAASGDFDGDGFDDLAIAAQYSEPGSTSGAIYFYKGVAQAPEEKGTGTTYVAWFREDIAFAAGQRHQIVLTTGDTHGMTGPDTTNTVADGIDELIVGLPGAARVEVWVINGNGRFPPGDGTFGGHGVGKKIVITASQVGIGRGAESSDFGASLAAGRFFNGDGDDLAIGAPTGETVMGRAPIGGGPTTVVSGGPAVYLLPEADPARALEIQDGDGDTADQFGAALAVLVDFDKNHDTLVVGAPGTDTTQGEVSVYRRAYLDSSNRPVAPDLLETFSGSTTGGGFGRALLAFTTRESGAASDTHWIAVGAPSANINGTKSGAVELLSINYAGERRSEHRMMPANRHKGMNFGRALALHQGGCTTSSCPKDRVWIAIGSPQSPVGNDDKAGQVHLWKVWNGTTVNNSFKETWSGSNEDARYGQEVIPVRYRQNGGGFLILGKKTELPVVSGTSTTMVRTGFAQVRFNKSSSPNWSNWIHTLGPNTAGDYPPKNKFGG